jgi:transcription termination/antitermination protein NusG
VVSDLTVFDGDMGRVVRGPFASFDGVVQEVDDAHSSLKVAVTIFGRVTDVDLQFGDVETI